MMTLISPQTRFNGLYFCADCVCLSPLCSARWDAKFDRSRENAEKDAFWGSGSSKVIEFGINRKGLCDFLLAVNSNLGRILHGLKATVTLVKKSPLRPTSPVSYNAFATVTPCEYVDEPYIANTKGEWATRRCRRHRPMFIYFDTITACVGQTDGQTDGQNRCSKDYAQHSCAL